MNDRCGAQPDENPTASLEDINVCLWSNSRLSALTSCMQRITTHRYTFRALGGIAAGSNEGHI